MLIPHLTKLIALLLFVVIITALPAPPSTLGNAAATHCQPGCQPMYTRCLSRTQNVDFCHELVCEYYSAKCTSCQSCAFNLSPTTAFTAPDADQNAVVDVDKRTSAKPPPNKCIIICTHAHCDLLCTNPDYPPSSSTANSVHAVGVANATDLLATTNSQPDSVGVPLTPGMNIVVLGQKENEGVVEKCAWFCRPDTLTCEESCWAADEFQDAVVTDGDFPSADEAMEGLAECQVVDKGEVGRLIVCAVPVVDGRENISTGDGGMNGMRCMLFWRGRTPHLVCRKV